ncbi:MAG: PSD1 and planctomycete cytochrome C domain-containing protein [Planctomycetota bacterium]
MVNRIFAFVSRVSLVLTTFVVFGATARQAKAQEPAVKLAAVKLAAVKQPIRYGRDIRPLLSDRCFLCHGPDQRERSAELRLDERRFAIADRGDGEAAIVPGNPAASLLLDRVRSSDPDERMPPPASHKAALLPDEVARLEQWIAEGAIYEEHWSFVPPQQAPLPAAPDDTKSAAKQSAAKTPEAKHPVDAFLDHAMAERGVQPTAAADPAALVRRLYLVLTGLPPTPAERDAFLAERDEGAYERLVDKLLATEPYATRHAEHLASLWLDAARFADTSGIHMDAGRQAHLWRDWLIEALRRDKPFDEFIVEQLAGDLIPDATPEQLVATGFLRNQITTDEGGAINAEYLVEYAAERTETVGSVFLGLTVGCARCHDHKYDPITQEDYYRLFSFFNNNEEPGLYRQSPNAFRALEPNLSVPTREQTAKRADLDDQIAAAKQQLQQIPPGEDASFRSFVDRVGGELGLHWTRPRVASAQSAGGAVLTTLRDGSVLGSGDNPDKDVQTYVLETGATQQRWLCLEALTDPSLPKGGVSRASHANAVLQHFELAVRPRGARDDAWQDLGISYALADVEQQNGDFGVGNALTNNGHGWAVAGHKVEGPRVAWFLTDRAFGFEEGTELRVRLHYDSKYVKHVLGRVRFATSRGHDAGLASAPLQTSGYFTVGAFTAKGSPALYDTAFGPETATSIDLMAPFGGRSWKYRDTFDRRGTNKLANGVNVMFVGQRVFAASPRTVDLSLGSDDGFVLYLDGKKIAERRVNRGVQLNQDRVQVKLTAGEHLLVMRIVNTGGAGGFALQHVPHEGELQDDLFLAMLPDVLGSPDRLDRLQHAWRLNRSPIYRQRSEQLAALEQRRTDLDASTPMAMVMRERKQMRPTYVLARGEYDKADKDRPVQRELPSLFGPMPAELPRNRLGLAKWLVSSQNPLVRRVAVNRLWEFVFGTGLVRTSEDFGRQGEWPSHPELLDWLACEFAERKHSVRSMLKLMVTSAAFQRQGRVGPAAATLDAEDRLLSWYPRRRLTAEAIRDQALYVGGMLVERAGGPSVKPYQPTGLWSEVAMPQSNTRRFVRGDGDSLWRRSLYTYWKRACPPPSLLTFDAPTREFCTIRRGVTNTPLQALVLWNDEQFVEAARGLATRTMLEAPDDRVRIAAMYRRATGRELNSEQAERSLKLLRAQQRRYREEPKAADALLQVGEQAPNDKLSPPDLAAFTLLASAFLDLDATLYID